LAAAQVQREAAFGETPEKERSVLLHFIENGSELALRDTFHEELEGALVGRGADGIGALEGLVADFDAECGVLASEIRVGPAGIDFQDEEVFGDFTAIKDAGGKEFVWTGDQESPQGIGCETQRNVTGKYSRLERRIPR